jgi:hypothetical protein
MADERVAALSRALLAMLGCSADRKGLVQYTIDTAFLALCNGSSVSSASTLKVRHSTALLVCHSG